MILSILIATIKDREPLFKKLMDDFRYQIFLNDAENMVEVCYIQDNRELPIGDKRQQLLEMSAGEYIVFFDDDDEPYEYYLEEILKALEFKPDNLGYKIRYTYDGQNPRECVHSLKYKTWHTSPDGNTFYRNVTHFNVVKRSLALKVGFKSLRYGEDQPYADQLTELCKKEVFIDKYMFHYRYSSEIPHNKKYGIE